MNHIIAHTVVFFYVYILSFKFIPIGTRAIFGLLGLIWFLARLLQDKFELKVDKYFAKFLTFLSSIGLISIISISFNGTTDTEFAKYVISIIFLIFSSYFVISILEKLNYKLCFKSISEIIVNVVFIQSFMALFMFFLPELQDFLMGIQRFSDLAEEQVDVYKAYRVIGFGTMFFDAGIISGYALILIGIKIRIYKYTSQQLFFLSLKFLAITTVGLAMARTTMIGAIIALTIIFIPRNYKLTISLVKNRFFILFYIAIIPTILISIVFFSYPDLFLSLEPVLDFAFEMFINYADKGSLETDSSNVLKTLFIIPTDIKTYIIGDGYFSDPNGNGYYMHTDIGYLRLIYYFGIGGLSIFLFLQYYSIYKSFKGMGISYVIALFIFAYLLILNLKGFADILSFTMLYWMHLLTAEKRTDFNPYSQT